MEPEAALGPHSSNPSDVVASATKMEVRQEKMTNKDKVECVFHVWTPSNQSRPLGVVVVFHGLGGHGLYPTVRYLSELLAENQFVVYSLDFCGHGESKGLRGLLPSPAYLLRDAHQVCGIAREAFPHLPFFLAGASMGGSIALLTSLELPFDTKLLLLTPLVSLPIPTWQRWVVSRLASWAPRMGLTKASSDALNYHLRDDERRQEARDDPLVYKGRLRAATARTSIELSDMVRGKLNQFSSPMLCLLALEDYVVDNDGIDDLIEQSTSNDKTLKEYNALHGLMCEALPLRNDIERDITSWVRERAGQGEN